MTVRYAGLKGHIAIFDWLLATGLCDMKAKEHGKNTFDYACISGFSKIIERILW